MQEKYDIVIADTSYLILLSKIEEIKLLSLIFSKVSVTSIVANEFGLLLPKWIEVIDNSKDKSINLLEMEVDKGEASSISLCLEYKNPLLIIDDLKGRKLASKLKLNYVGTFGILLKAKELGLIENPGMLIEKIRNTNFYFSDELLNILR